MIYTMKMQKDTLQSNRRSFAVTEAPPFWVIGTRVAAKKPSTNCTRFERAFASRTTLADCPKDKFGADSSSK
jgi:hypothetical protein